MLDDGGWRSADTVEYLKRTQRIGFAWEFLRRNPDYRRDFEVMNRLLQNGTQDDLETVLALVRRWGLGFPLRPNAPVQSGSGRLGRCSAANDRHARQRSIRKPRQRPFRRLSRPGPG